MVVEAAIISASAALLKKPFEDLLANSKSGLTNYFQKWKAESELQALAQKIEQVGKINTIASRQSSTIDEIYYPAQVKHGKSSRKVTSANDLVSERVRLALIQGTAGQGKSIFLRYLCLQELRSASRIPIFIELRKIDQDNDLPQLFRNHLLSLGFEEHLLDTAIDAMLSSGKIRIFLDGFDEVKREYALKVKEHIQRLLNKNKNLQIVLSSRPGALGQYLADIAGIQTYEIASLSSADYPGFFEKIGVPTDTKNRLVSAIENSNAQIKHLLSTPLMLTLLVLTCGMQQDLPDTLPEFYDSLFNLLASMHDGTKPGYVRQKATSLSNQDLEHLFRAFSFAAKESIGKVSLNARQFEQTFKHATEISGIKCTLDGFRTDVTETICLMVREGLDTTFVHKSIQEYYAASFIRHIENEDMAKQVFESIANNHLYSWMNEMRFLEDFQHLAYEKFIGIPHAEIFVSKLTITGRKKLAVSKVKFEEWLEEFGVSVVVTTKGRQVLNLYWRPDLSKGIANRYYLDLVLALSKEIKGIRKTSSESGIADDSLQYVQITKLFKELPSLRDKLISTTEKVCEGVITNTKKMKDRNLRRNKGLLDLMRIR